MAGESWVMLPRDSTAMLKLQGWNPGSLLNPWGHMAEKHIFLSCCIFICGVFQ